MLPKRRALPPKRAKGGTLQSFRQAAQQDEAHRRGGGKPAREKNEAATTCHPALRENLKEEEREGLPKKGR